MNKFFLLFASLLCIQVYASEPTVLDAQEMMVRVDLPEPFGKTLVNIKLDAPHGAFSYAKIETELGVDELYGNTLPLYENVKLNEMRVMYLRYLDPEHPASFSVCIPIGEEVQIEEFQHTDVGWNIAVFVIRKTTKAVYTQLIPLVRTRRDIGRVMEENGCEMLNER